MQLRNEFTDSIARQNILIVADCLSGALPAAQFAIRNLYTGSSKIILLQTYQKRTFGQSMLRDIEPLLKKTASRELTELKNEMVKEYRIKPKSISKKIVEGELGAVLKRWRRNKPGTMVLMGIEPQSSNTDFNCSKLIKPVLNSGIRPVYIVNHSITMITDEKTIYFAGRREMLYPRYLNLLNKTLGVQGLNIMTLYPESNSLNSADEISNSFPQPKSGFQIDDLPLAEKLFRKLIAGNNSNALQNAKQLNK